MSVLESFEWRGDPINIQSLFGNDHEKSLPQIIRIMSPDHRAGVKDKCSSSNNNINNGNSSSSRISVLSNSSCCSNSSSHSCSSLLQSDMVYVLTEVALEKRVLLLSELTGRYVTLPLNHPSLFTPLPSSHRAPDSVSLSSQSTSSLSGSINRDIFGEDQSDRLLGDIIAEDDLREERRVQVSRDQISSTNQSSSVPEEMQTHSILRILDVYDEKYLLGYQVTEPAKLHPHLVIIPSHLSIHVDLALSLTCPLTLHIHTPLPSRSAVDSYIPTDFSVSTPTLASSQSSSSLSSSSVLLSKSSNAPHTPEIFSKTQRFYRRKTDVGVESPKFILPSEMFTEGPDSPRLNRRPTESGTPPVPGTPLAPGTPALLPGSPIPSVSPLVRTRSAVPLSQETLSPSRKDFERYRAWMKSLSVTTSRLHQQKIDCFQGIAVFDEPPCSDYDSIPPISLLSDISDDITSLDDPCSTPPTSSYREMPVDVAPPTHRPLLSVSEAPPPQPGEKISEGLWADFSKTLPIPRRKASKDSTTDLRKSKDQKSMGKGRESFATRTLSNILTEVQAPGKKLVKQFEKLQNRRDSKPGKISEEPFLYSVKPYDSGTLKPLLTREESFAEIDNRGDTLTALRANHSVPPPIPPKSRFPHLKFTLIKSDSAQQKDPAPSHSPGTIRWQKKISAPILQPNSNHYVKEKLCKAKSYEDSAPALPPRRYLMNIEQDNSLIGRNELRRSAPSHDKPMTSSHRSIVTSHQAQEHVTSRDHENLSNRNQPGMRLSSSWQNLLESDSSSANNLLSNINEFLDEISSQSQGELGTPSKQFSSNERRLDLSIAPLAKFRSSGATSQTHLSYKHQEICHQSNESIPELPKSKPPNFSEQQNGNENFASLRQRKTGCPSNAQQEIKPPLPPKMSKFIMAPLESFPKSDTISIVLSSQFNEAVEESAGTSEALKDSGEYETYDHQRAPVLGGVRAECSRHVDEEEESIYEEYEDKRKDMDWVSFNQLQQESSTDDLSYEEMARSAQPGGDSRISSVSCASGVYEEYDDDSPRSSTSDQRSNTSRASSAITSNQVQTEFSIQSTSAAPTIDQSQHLTGKSSAPVMTSLPPDHVIGHRNKSNRAPLERAERVQSRSNIPKISVSHTDLPLVENETYDTLKPIKTLQSADNTYEEYEETYDRIGSPYLNTESQHSQYVNNQGWGQENKDSSDYYDNNVLASKNPARLSTVFPYDNETVILKQENRQINNFSSSLTDKSTIQSSYNLGAKSPLNTDFSMNTNDKKSVLPVSMTRQKFYPLAGESKREPRGVGRASAGPTYPVVYTDRDHYDLEQSGTVETDQPEVAYECDYVTHDAGEYNGLKVDEDLYDQLESPRMRRSESKPKTYTNKTLQRVSRLLRSSSTDALLMNRGGREGREGGSCERRGSVDHLRVKGGQEGPQAAGNVDKKISKLIPASNLSRLSTGLAKSTSALDMDRGAYADMQGARRLLAAARPIKLESSYRQNPPPITAVYPIQRFENPLALATNQQFSNNASNLPPANSGLSAANIVTGRWNNIKDVPRDISGLTVDEVCQCLRLLNMGKHTQMFLERQVDGSLLQDLDKKTLQEDFGFCNFDAIKLSNFSGGWRPKVSEG